MSWTQFAMSLSTLVGAAVAVYAITAWQDRREKHRRHPGE